MCAIVPCLLYTRARKVLTTLTTKPRAIVHTRVQAEARLRHVLHFLCAKEKRLVQVEDALRQEHDALKGLHDDISSRCARGALTRNEKHAPSPPSRPHNMGCLDKRKGVPAVLL